MFPKREGGFTLMELVIASALTAIIVTAVCSVYMYSLRSWERGRATSMAYSTAVFAVKRLEDRIEKSISGYRIHNTYTGDSLILRFPITTDSLGNYVPIWYSPNPTYKSTFIYDAPSAIPYTEIFYLSDISGNRSVPGDILWRGTYKTGIGWVPDEEWSLASTNPRQGRIANVKSLGFSYGYYGASYYATVTITVEQNYGKQTSQVILSRRIRMRNHN